MDKAVICKIGVTKKGKIPFWYQDDDENYIYCLFKIDSFIDVFIDDYKATPLIYTHSILIDANDFPTLLRRDQFLETGIYVIKVADLFFKEAYETSKYPDFKRNYSYTKPVKKTRKNDKKSTKTTKSRQ